MKNKQSWPKYRILAKELIDLDECVIGALNLFVIGKIPKLEKFNFKKPIVLGSGNAAVTGKIIFEGTDAVFADESNYMKKLKGRDGAVLISASGGKHAPIIAKELKKKGIKTVLLTNNPSALASKYVNKTYIFPKQVEPYTYNTSTYMSMILSKTNESPKKILSHVEKKIKPRIPKNLRNYDAFYIIVPDEFDSMRELFMTKFDELFGPMISGRVFTPDQTEHAKTIVESNKELFVSIGYDNKTWGKHRVNLPLFKGAKHAAVMASIYYFIGHIQKQNKPYFKEGIEKYTKKVSKLFGQEIKPIVE